MSNPEKLISWFKYLDVEYLDQDLCSALSLFDINDPADQTAIIQKAIVPEFRQLNDKSKQSLKQILVDADGFSDAQVTAILDRVSMPFAERLIDYRAFLKRLISELY